MNTKQLTKRVLELAVEIQQIPAPTFDEKKRGEFIRGKFSNEGLQDVAVDDAGNIYGRLPGKGKAHPVVVSAHLDTVFPASTDLSVKREPDKISGPGIGDNSTGVAGLLGLIWALRKKATNGATTDLPGDIWLVANTGEEGLGDLRGMKKVVDRFGEAVTGYIILEGMALGQVYHRGLGVQRYRIQARTRGGHSWVDYGCASAIHELAAWIVKLNEIRLPNEPRTTLNVGVIRGGTSINTIAPEADLQLDLRSESESALGDLIEKVLRLVESSKREDVDFSAEMIGKRPAGFIAPNHPLVLTALQTLQEVGMNPRLNCGSTDANIPLSRGLPAVCIGLTHGSGAHTTGEFIYTEPLETGLQQLVKLVENVLRAAG